MYGQPVAKVHFPGGDEVNEILRAFRGLTREFENETNVREIRAILSDLSALLSSVRPVGVGSDTLSAEERSVFLVWDQTMAMAVGIDQSDAVRLARKVAGARRRNIQVEESGQDFVQVVSDLAGVWHQLAPADRKAAAGAIREGSQAHLLGFANGFIQNEAEGFPTEWRDLLWALGRCLAHRVAENWDDLRENRGNWRKILDPFAEQSMFGARVIVDRNVEILTRILAKVVPASVR